MSQFFGFYKNANIVLKVLLFGVVILMGLLWLVGSLTKLDRLVMFIVGTIIGGALINIFLYDYVVEAIAYFGALI